MRPVTVTKTGAGSSEVVVMDHHMVPFNVGMGVTVSGTVNYTIQHTFENVVAGVTPTYFDHPVLKNLTANADGNYAFPVTGIRLTVNSGSGSATLTIVQAGT